jgi:hypothetical protein
MVPKAGLYQRGLLKSLKTWAIPSSPNSFHALRHSIGFFLFVAFYRLLSRLLTPI